MNMKKWILILSSCLLIFVFVSVASAEWVQDANGKWVNNGSLTQPKKPACDPNKWIQDGKGKWVKQTCGQQPQVNQPKNPTCDPNKWVQGGNGKWVKQTCGQPNQKASTPTRVPVATPTRVPASASTYIKPGMYRVGSEIQPGLYRGRATTGLGNSCYWERLSNLSGQLSGIIANDFVMNGQFYVQIAPSDVAFDTDCRLEYLPNLPEPVANFPLTVAEGTYLVGREIKPGLYEGTAFSGLGNSCYWERLSNLGGDLNAIIANDFVSEGRFFVQISASDKALHTGCTLKFVE